MRTRDIFNPASLWSQIRRSIRPKAVFCTAQILWLAVLPVLAQAGGADWKYYYDQGEQSLEQQKPAEAEQYLRQALNIAASHSSDSEETQKCLAKLAGVLALRNKIGEADRLYQRLLSLLAKKSGNQQEMVPVLMSLGSIRESLGDHKAAIVYYQRALAINERRFGPYSPEFAGNLHALARANGKKGDTGTAAKQYKQAISILMKEPSLEASEQLKVVVPEYSDLLKGSDDSDKSLIKDFKEDILNQPEEPAHLPPAHSAKPVNKGKKAMPGLPSANGAATLPAAHISAALEANPGQSKQAENGNLQRFLASSGSQLLPGSSDQIAAPKAGPLEREGRTNLFGLDYNAAISTSNLSPEDSTMLQLRPAILAQSVAGGLAPSSPTSDVPIQTLEQTTQPQDSGAAKGESAWQKHAVIELNASKRAQLDEEPAVVLRGLEKPWSAGTLSPAYRIVNQSIVNQSGSGQTESYCQRKIAVDIDTLGPHHPSVANDLSGLAQIYLHGRDYASAEPLLSRAYAIYLESYGADNILSINTGADLALVLCRLGQLGRAEQLYRSVLTHCQSALGPNSFETASVLNQLASLYFNQGKLQQASTLYKWALASTEAALGPESPLLAACMQDGAKVLRSLGRAGEAEALEARADRILITKK